MVPKMFVGLWVNEQKISSDFTSRETLAKRPVRKPLIDAYGIGNPQINVLSIEEIFAEKLHALGSRSAPRDVYDVWFLVEQGVEIDKNVLVKKFAYYGEKFDAGKALANARKGEGNWMRDLRYLVRNLPDFITIEREVERKLGQLS